MLCRVFAQNGQVPSNLGLAFREFTQLYDREIQADALIDSQDQWQKLLRHLAFALMQEKHPTEFRLSMPREEAEILLTECLEQEGRAHPRGYAERWLKDLLNHHLIQPVMQPNLEEHIEFRHQLIQEYYAAFLCVTRSEAAISDLIHGLEDKDRDVRWRAAEALGKFGGEQAIPGLIQALEDEDRDMRWRVAEALGKLGGEQAIPGLIQVLEDADRHVRRSEAEALGKLGQPRSLPKLQQVWAKTAEWAFDSAISKIQGHCQFYNFEIAQAMEQSAVSHQPSAEERSAISGQPSATSTTVVMTFNAPVSGVAGHVAGNQNIDTRSDDENN